jgi:hypothetical protein
MANGIVGAPALASQRRHGLPIAPGVVVTVAGAVAVSAADMTIGMVVGAVIGAPATAATVGTARR